MSFWRRVGAAFGIIFYRLLYPLADRKASVVGQRFSIVFWFEAWPERLSKAVLGRQKGA